MGKEKTKPAGRYVISIGGDAARMWSGSLSKQRKKAKLTLAAIYVG